MSAQAYIHSTIQLARFREHVAIACRHAGRLQRELANAMGIDAKVLSRKLHGARQALPSHLEVKRIILVLASWDAITSQAEAIELLSLMGLRVESFTPEEWNSEPLSRLQPAPGAGKPSTTTTSLPTHLRVRPLPTSSTPLIGREKQMEIILAQLKHPDIRLLTLLGTGGIGKTRLALEVAHASQPEFTAGAGWVSLAAIRDSALVPGAIVQALGLQEPRAIGDPGQRNIISPEDQLMSALQDQAFLLVLDNVEHLPEIVHFINALLTNIATLKILVTSRVVLHLRGEHIIEVPSLAVYVPGVEDDPADVARVAAIRLFVERARALDFAFQPTARTLLTIAQICARLDGLPLAIELAAGRTNVLPLTMILARLMDETAPHLTFLRSTLYDMPSRHQTLQGTLDWSYALLDPVHRRLFRRLSVFSGSWTVRAALEICQKETRITEDELLEQLETLIDSSLVRRMPDEDGAARDQGELRFYFLETIHDYGKAWLEADGEKEELQRRYAIYYLSLAENQLGQKSGRELLERIYRLAHDQTNLRAAVSWFIEHHEAEMAQRLCVALERYWEARCLFQDARQAIDAALVINRETAPASRARLLKVAARIALWEMEWDRSRGFAQEALALYTEAGDIADKAWALFHIGDTWHLRGNYQRAIAYFEESLQLFRLQADWGSYAFTLSRLGATATLVHDFPQSQAWLDEALSLHRSLEKKGWLTVTLVSLGVLALLQNHLEQSTAYLLEALQLARQTGNRYMLALDLLVFGCLLGTRIGPDYAARMCSGAEGLFTRLETSLPPSYHSLYHTHLQGLKVLVEEALWEQWWVEGTTLAAEELIALAINASETLQDSTGDAH